MAICTFANNSGECWPSRAAIGDRIGIRREKTVSESIGNLEKIGFLAVKKFSGRSNNYSINPGRKAPRAESAQGVGAESAPQKEYIEPIYATEAKTQKSTQKVSTQKPKVAITETCFSVPDSIMESWVKAYPAADIPGEIRRSFAWCISNPAKAPRKNFGRFLNSWLSRVKPSASSPQKPDCDPTDPYRDCSPEQIAAINAFGERMMLAEAERGNYVAK